MDWQLENVIISRIHLFTFSSRDTDDVCLSVCFLVCFFRLSKTYSLGFSEIVIIEFGNFSSCMTTNRKRDPDIVSPLGYQ